MYLNQKKGAMLNGRVKVFALEDMLAKRLGIDIQCRQGSVYERIETRTKQLIDQDIPVLIYVDMPYLSYLGLDAESHFGGHAVILFGYDDEKQRYYVSDRDQEDAPIRTPNGKIQENYHFVSYEEIKRARSSSHPPFPAKNKYLEINFDGYCGIQPAAIKDAIHQVCDQMLQEDAQLLGVRGILKFSKEIKKWKNYTPDQFRQTCITNYFQISADGGTSGGIFRHMYGMFLKEAAGIVGSLVLETYGDELIQVGTQWDEIAQQFWTMSTLADDQPNGVYLEDISNRALSIYYKEKEIFEMLRESIG